MPTSWPRMFDCKATSAEATACSNALTPAAALFTPDDEAPAEDVLATVLELCRVACGADAAVVLRRVDEVTAIALASAPAALLPDGVTSPALLDRAGAECAYYGPQEVGGAVPARLRGAVAVIPCASRQPYALIIVRRSGAEFTPECRAFLAAQRGVLKSLVRLYDATLQAEALQARVDAMVLTLPHALLFTEDSGAETWLNTAAAALLAVPAGTVPARSIAAVSVGRRADFR